MPPQAKMGRTVRGFSESELTETLDDLRNRIVAERADLREALERTKLKRALAMLLVGLRKREDLTQSELADAAGWDKAFVSRLESAGDQLPNLETIVRYAKVCGADLRLYVEGDDAIEGVVLNDKFQPEAIAAGEPAEPDIYPAVPAAQPYDADE